MAVRQYDVTLGADKVAVRATKQTVSAPGGGIVVRVIVDDGAAGVAGKASLWRALQMAMNVVKEQDYPAA